MFPIIFDKNKRFETLYQLSQIVAKKSEFVVVVVGRRNNLGRRLKFIRNIFK